MQIKPNFFCYNCYFLSLSFVRLLLLGLRVPTLINFKTASLLTFLHKVHLIADCFRVVINSEENGT